MFLAHYSQRDKKINLIPDVYIPEDTWVLFIKSKFKNLFVDGEGYGGFSLNKTVCVKLQADHSLILK